MKIIINGWIIWCPAGIKNFTMVSIWCEIATAQMTQNTLLTHQGDSSIGSRLCPRSVWGAVNIFNRLRSIHASAVEQPWFISTATGTDVLSLILTNIVPWNYIDKENNLNQETVHNGIAWWIQRLMKKNRILLSCLIDGLEIKRWFISNFLVNLKRRNLSKSKLI